MVGSNPTVYLSNGTTRYLQYNGTAYVLANASLIVNGTTYTSSRDLKYMIKPIAFDSLESIKKTQTVSFKYKPGNPKTEDRNQDTHHGLIAEDTPPEFLSADGKGVAAHSTLAIALDAIKQLTLRSEALEKRVEALEAQLAAK
jgi:hypothetical protein